MTTKEILELRDRVEKLVPRTMVVSLWVVFLIILSSI